MEKKTKNGNTEGKEKEMKMNEQTRLGQSLLEENYIAMIMSR